MAQIRRPDHLPGVRLRRPVKLNEKSHDPDTCYRPTEISVGRQMLEKEINKLNDENFDSKTIAIIQQYDLMLVEDSKEATNIVFGIFCKFSWLDRFQEPLVAKFFLEMAAHDTEKSEYTLLSQLESTCDSLLGVLTLLGQPTAQQCGAITLLSNLSRVTSLPQEHREAVVCYLIDIGKAFWPYFTEDTPYYWGSNIFCDALCDVLKTVGKLLEEQYPVNSERTFVMINKLVISGTVSAYSRLRLLEVKDRQSYNWQLSEDSEEYYRDRYFEALSKQTEESKTAELDDSSAQVLNNTKVSHRKLRQPRHLSQNEMGQTQDCESPPGSEPCSPSVFTLTKANFSEEFQNGEVIQEICSGTVLPADTEQSPQGKPEANLTNDDNGTLGNSVCSKNAQTISEPLQKGELSKNDNYFQSAVISSDKNVTNEKFSSPNHVLMNLGDPIGKDDESENAKDTAINHDREQFGFQGFQTGEHSIVERNRKISKGSDSSDNSESSCLEIQLSDSECKRMNRRHRAEIATLCGCQLYLNNSVLVISGNQENMKSAKRKVYEVLSAPEDRYGVLVTIPEEILSCLESDANTASFIDKLGNFSGANIKKITDEQLFVSGYRECVDCVKSCMGKMNYVLKFGNDPELVDKTDDLSDDSTLTSLERLFRIIDLDAHEVPERRNSGRIFNRSSSASDTHWREPAKRSLQRGFSWDAVPVPSMEPANDQSENETGLSRKFILSFARCPQALERPADLSLDRNEDWVPLIVLPQARNPFERLAQSSRPFMRQTSGGFGLSNFKSSRSFELPNEPICVLEDKSAEPPEMTDVRAS